MAAKNITPAKQMTAWWLDRIRKLKTVSECRAFAKEVADRPDLVTECRVQEARVTPLRKDVPEPVTSVERIYNDMRTLESLGGENELRVQNRAQIRAARLHLRAGHREESASA